MLITFYTKEGAPYQIRVAPKQKIIQVHRNNYIDFEFNQRAQKKLSAEAYMLYMYLLTRSRDRAWVLSSKDVYENTTLKKRTYSRAINELIEAGYLIKKEIQIKEEETYTQNTYHLLEHPQLPF